MNKLRMAVVGVGALGRHHARILSGFDDVELVGVVDSRAEQGKEIARLYDTVWYSSVDHLLSCVDGVVVAVPTTGHRDVAGPILEAGIPVLMEKPLASSLADAAWLHRLATFRDTLLQVGHVERFNPAFQLLQKQCVRPLYIRTQRFSPYTFRSTDIGVVHDLMIHDIDLALALTAADVESVESFGAVTIGPHEDMANARLRTSTGCIVDLSVSRMNPTVERSVQVWSHAGYCHADLQTRKLSTWKPAAAFAADPGLVHEIAAGTGNPGTLKDAVIGKWLRHHEQQASSADALTAELRDFIDSIRQQRRPVVSSAEAMRSMEVADQVLSGMQLWLHQPACSPVDVRRAA